jgi:uncharacterized protein (DUF488 family)
VSTLTIWTVGHSNVSFEVLLNALRVVEIELVVDVRMFPQSRRHPQFNRDRLAASLREAGIEYQHMPSLGGRRTPLEDSTNLGLRDEGFRGFADFMQTPEFETALQDLYGAAEAARTAIMCAEAGPSHCHRSLISDALCARGISVWHLAGGEEFEHKLTPSARIDGESVTYPALL